MAEDDNQLEGMEEVIQEFLAESAEGLDNMDNELIALEADPTNCELLANIFRTVHSIKGTCGFLGYSNLETVTHVGENLLSRLRDGKLGLSPEIATSLLSLVDALREMLSAIESTGTDGEKTYPELVQALARLNEGAPIGGEQKQDVPVPAVIETSDPETGIHPAPGEAANSGKPGHPKASSKPRVGTADQSDPGSAAAGASQDNELKNGGPLSASESAIRVDVDILDDLMNLVGELVLARNQIMQYTATHQDTVFANACQRLNLITSELQRDMMKTRMQPINNIWSKFPRVVRDLSRNCGKQVRVDMTGKETELDKTLIEAIKDPLTHLVRNSIDHGIETPEERIAKGKTPEGCLVLSAYHEGGQVIIEIADDGAGINVERVLEMAVERGVVTTAQASQMSERDIAKLIFMPGFSTADEVTNISGRGVGMDVVKTNIEKISGFIELDTERDKGTSIRIQLPLTLAIIPALLVRSGNERFAIPQASLLELIRVDKDTTATGIEMIHGAPVYRLRGNLLPLVYLNRELKLSDCGRAADGPVNIVVLQADKKSFGLVVDKIEDSQEIVVKPLSKVLKQISVFAGSTIMGDGKVALILDVLGLAHRASLISETQGYDNETNPSVSLHGNQMGQRTVIITQTPDGGRLAMDLDQVVRLEEFPRSRLEQAGSQTVVQYRDAILPLLSLTELLQERRTRSRKESNDLVATSDDMVPVIVCAVDGHTLGLIVDKIVDIVDHDFTIEGPSTRKGILGTTVIQEKVTEVFDMKALKHRLLTRSKSATKAEA